MQFLNAGAYPELVAALRGSFSQRGVPLQLPLHDLADSAALRPADVQQRVVSMLLPASERYATEHMVSVSLGQQVNGEWAGDWSYFFRDSPTTRRIVAASPEEFMRQGADLVAGEMASRYAVLPNRSAPGEVQVHVSGISSYADYADIVSWLERLELVDAVRVRGLTGGRLELGLDGQADAGQLAALIALNRHLVAVAEPLPGWPLEYQWQK